LGNPALNRAIKLTTSRAVVNLAPGPDRPGEPGLSEHGAIVKFNAILGQMSLTVSRYQVQTF
jgi:hypothetical protein